MVDSQNAVLSLINGISKAEQNANFYGYA